MLDLGDAYTGLGSVAEAEQMYLMAEKIGAVTSLQKFRLATIFGQSGRFSEAIALEDEISQMVADSDPVLIPLAQNYARQGMQAEAQQIYQRWRLVPGALGDSGSG